MPTYALTADQKTQYDRDGYLFPLRALDDAQVAQYLSLYHDYVARNEATLAGMAGREKYQVFSETHFIMRWVYDIVTNPRVLDAAESVIGPNILAWNSNWFAKMPGEKTYVGWHQDGTYWRLTPPNVVTAWVALSPSVRTNGCMRVLRGTHAKPPIPHRETYEPDNALSRGQQLDMQFNEADAVDLELQPGEFSLHHLWIAHGSDANTSTVPRIGIAIRYVAAEVHQDSPHKPLALLVRGKNTHGYFDAQDPPTSDDPSERAAMHRTIINRIREGVMAGAKKSR